MVAGSYGKELEGDCDLISGVDLVLLYFCGWVIYENIYDIFWRGRLVYNRYKIGLSYI